MFRRNSNWILFQLTVPVDGGGASGGIVICTVFCFPRQWGHSGVRRDPQGDDFHYTTDWRVGRHHIIS
jgi:hypothetical protein